MPREAGSFPQDRATAALAPAPARKAARASARLGLRPDMVVFDIVPKPAVTPLRPTPPALDVASEEAGS
jgi:hypothetical protein